MKIDMFYLSAHVPSIKKMICYVQVSLNAFSFLFWELVQYNQACVDNIAELEHRSFLLQCYIKLFG